MPPAGPRLEVCVTALAAGGDGVARLPDGRVVFVEGGLPGDRVELEDLVLEKRLARARIARVIEASPDRVPPRCAHFDRCGGCQWQHLAYPAQLEAKRRIVLDALERIGGLEAGLTVGIEASPEPYGYRARARLVEGASGAGYRRRGSHEIECVRDCPVLVPQLEALLPGLARPSGSEGPTPEGDAPGEAPSGRRGRARAPREWTLLAGSSGAPVVLPMGARRARSEPPPAVELEVAGERLRASATSFVQGNALLWDALALAVVDRATAPLDDSPPRRFLELYAGIGFLTLPLARRGLAGVAVESDRSALADLGHNLRRAGLADRVEVRRARAEALRDLGAQLDRAEVLVADPPRVGLHAAVREAIADRGPRRFVYLSCDPATLARDLAALVAADYRLASVRVFDLFPQTSHVETLAVLEREGAPPSGLPRSRA